MAGVAPIGVFAYNRPEHLTRALRALARCPELPSSPLVVFCDGPKPGADQSTLARIAETRRVAHELAPSHARIVEREHNLGLATSMRTGVGSLCDELGRAIVLEDDLEVSSTFLQFMNAGLDHYADEPRVMQVSGYMYPLHVAGSEDALFMPLISCWGWGVWARSWAQLGKGVSWYTRLERESELRRRFDLNGAYPYFEMLKAQHRGEIDSWGIGWYLDVFAADGLVLFPRTSLVANRGHDGSGSHREQSSPFEADAHDFAPKQLPAPRLDQTQYAEVCEYIRRATRGGITAHLGRLLRRAKGMLPHGWGLR